MVEDENTQKIENPLRVQCMYNNNNSKHQSVHLYDDIFFYYSTDLIVYNDST